MRKGRLELSYEYVNSILEYDPESGNIYWKVDKVIRSRAGDLAGSKNPSGYIHIFIDNRSYKAHRLAWLLYYKAWPEKDIDHINNCRADNRISNLRDVTQRENNANRKDSTSGVAGVYFEARSGNWYAQIWHKKVKTHLGTFSTFEEAVEARWLAEANLDNVDRGRASDGDKR